MSSLTAEHKAVLFTAGGVRLALRLSQVLEVVAIPADAGEVSFRGGAVPALPVAVALGLPAAPTRFAIVTEASPPVALRVEAVQGIVDLAGAEFFRLPTRTSLPEPPPFQGALVAGGELALELSVGALGWVPMEPARDLPGPPAELDFATGRELLFERRGRTCAVPLHLLVQVLERPRVFPVPLTPAAHRGVLYQGRAVHPVFDVAVLYGEPPGDDGGLALLVEAGATTIAVLADRVLAAGERREGDVSRPSWELMLG
jgi:chemotaxis signal transduction protein